jgi:DNA-binding NtrC family response regulator
MTQKVLVVDDDHDCTSALGEILRAESFSVRCAGGGEQALAQIEDDLPDVVLTDIRMPGMDGYELLKRIRERFSSVRVVLMSAEGDLPSRSLAAGAHGYVAKPLEIEEVVLAIGAALASPVRTAENS